MFTVQQCHLVGQEYLEVQSGFKSVGKGSDKVPGVHHQCRMPLCLLCIVYNIDSNAEIASKVTTFSPLTLLDVTQFSTRVGSERR